VKVYVLTEISYDYGCSNTLIGVYADKDSAVADARNLTKGRRHPEDYWHNYYDVEEHEVL
jgi:hypothetical protein